jgi:hypothetical protein
MDHNISYRRLTNNTVSHPLVFGVSGRQKDKILLTAVFPLFIVRHGKRKPVQEESVD